MFLQGFIRADELADELHNVTKNPLTLDADTIGAAAQGITTIAAYATQHKKVLTLFYFETMDILVFDGTKSLKRPCCKLLTGSFKYP